MDKLTFEITDSLKRFTSDKASWFYIHIPRDEATSIKFFTSDRPKGWGSVPVQVAAGETTWKTSIFPDKESGGYLLFIKAEVRKREKISYGDEVWVRVEVEL